MRLSLLIPPTESPRTVPVYPTLTNWPTERNIAVDTSALPARNPALIAMDPSIGTGTFEALARLGATGATLGTDMLNVVLAAEAKKREADDVAQASGLYTQAAETIDRELTTLETSTDHTTLRPAFDELWKKVAGDALASAPNNAVRQTLGLKLAGFRLTKSAEVSDVVNRKFVDFQKTRFEGEIEFATKSAVSAPSDADMKYHLDTIESTSRAYARGGALPLEFIQKTREKALDKVTVDRAYNEAYLAPLTMLERIAKGDTFGLETKEVRTLSEYAENRIRTLRSDLQNEEAQRAKLLHAEQDDRAIVWRQRISANYGPGGPGMDLSEELSGAARLIGKENYSTLLEMHRTYRDRFLKPETATKSDPEYVGRAQYAIITGRLTEVTQPDLLRWFKEKKLDEGDYTRLSGLYDQKLHQQKAEGKQAQTEADAVRKEQIKDAEKAIDDYLARGSRYQGDPATKSSDILIRDGITELHLRLQADPTLDPGEVADEMIARRIAQAQRIAKTLPYKTKAEVQAAYVAGRLDKITATRYFRIMDALKEAGVEGGTEEATMTVPAPGLWQRLFGGQVAPTPNVRPPVKP